MNNRIPKKNIKFTANGLGNYNKGEVVYQGYSYPTATATAKVVSWSNNQLHLTNLNGNFISSEPVYGVNTLANYKFNSYTPTSSKYVEIDILPDPPSANASSNSRCLEPFASCKLPCCP